MKEVSTEPGYPLLFIKWTRNAPSRVWIDRLQSNLRGTPTMALSEELLSILVCPKCHGDLIYDSPASTLSCEACRLRYKVVDDIPVMLVDQAESY